MRLAKLLLLCAVIIWGWTFVATKIMLHYVTPVELLGLRMLIGMPLLFGLILIKKIKFDLTRREHFSILLGSVIVTAHFLIQITALKYTTATNTGWIISVTPLALAILSRIILKEKIGRRIVMGIGIATTGVLLLVSHGNFANVDWMKSVGDWLVLSTAFTWALYTISIRDIARQRDPALVTFAVFVPTSLVCIGYMLFNSDWSTFLNLPLEAAIALLFLGILGTALAQWIWQLAVARLGASQAGIFLYLEPVATTALAVPYMGEQFGIFTAIGGALVLLGVYYAERK